MFLTIFPISLLSMFAAATSSDLLRKEPLSLPSVKDAIYGLARSMAPIINANMSTSNSTVESKSASAVGLQVTPLTGYSKTGYYSDSGCSRLEIGRGYLLNTCYYSTYEGYAYIHTATATAITTMKYSDTACKTKYGSASVETNSDTCSYNRVKNFVGESLEFPSTTRVIYFK